MRKTVAVLIVGLCFAVGGHSEIVYEQPSTADFWRFAGTSSSGEQKVYDDFELETTESLTGVSWNGYFAGEGFAEPDNGYFSAFRISFYANSSSNFPGTLVYSTSIPAPAGARISTPNQYPLYEYSASLPTAFVAASGTKYWISIDATLTGPVKWYWMEGWGNGRSVGASPEGSGIYFNDLAYTLSTIPEPSSACLFLLGVLACMRKKRKKGAAV
jgi:hypothetical protein